MARTRAAAIRGVRPPWLPRPAGQDRRHAGQGGSYGGVLTSTLSAELTSALAGQGAVPDPATGLVYLGGGRFYDPALGRPLQPNPVGGPPSVPQALNRYAATVWGPPGVGEGAGNQLLSTFGKSVFKTTVTYFGFRPLQLAVVPKVPTWGPLSLRMSRYAWNRYYSDAALRAWFGRGVRYQKSFYTWQLNYRARQIGTDLFEVEGQELLWIRRGTRARIEVLYESYGLNPRIRFLSGAAWAFVLSGGVQLWSDWEDPYFTPWQKIHRAGIAGGEGAIVYIGTTVVAASLGLTNPVGIALLGLGVGFAWFSTAHPWALETFGPARERRLAPLP